MKRPGIVILASGSGTTAEAVIVASATGALDADIQAVIVNNPKAGIIDKISRLNQAHSLSIQCHYISSRNYPASDESEAIHGRQTDAEEAEILRVLNLYQPSLVALLGYMKLVGESIVEQYGYKTSMDSPYTAKMINTHPGLLPSTKGYYGIHVQEYVLEHDLEAGHCLFTVDTEYDGGPVVFEHQIKKHIDDTPDSLFERIKASERITIASDISTFLSKQRIQGGSHE